MTEPANLNPLHFTDKTYYSALQSSPRSYIFFLSTLFFQAKKVLQIYYFSLTFANYFYTSFFLWNFTHNR